MPRYHILRQYITAILLYYFLVFPTGMILWLKHSPEWLDKQGLMSEETADTTGGNGLRGDTLVGIQAGPVSFSLAAPGSDRNTRQQGINSAFGRISRLAFNALWIAMVVGLVVGYPYKRYFRRLRRGERISDRLRQWCRQQLLLTPLIHTGILGLAFLVIHIYILSRMLQIIPEGAGGIEQRLFRQFFYISLTGALLVIVFVYSWQKHRVHLRYIEHLFSREELRTRLFKRKSGRIRGRLWIASGMTTLFPLTIVVFYLFLSLTYVSDLGLASFNEDHANLLFGKYLGLFGNIPKTELARNFFYVNAIDSILMFSGIFTGVFVSLIYLLFYVRWNTEDIVGPVQELLSSMERTGEGQFGQYAMVRTNDEIGNLTQEYNRMSERMKAYFEDITALNLTYSQFVPQQFLDILGRTNYAEIRLGDQVEGEMSVLFSDIRAFTTLSEGMTPKESFDYINAYLGYMEPEIRRHGGFIDKYIGDAIMAVFPDKPDGAVAAAVSMREALQRFNEWSSLEKGFSINTGVGIHTGKLMMGIVGTEGRLSGTVISDAVNLASRLEGLNKVFGSAIIISDETREKLQYPSRFTMRSLGVAQLRGKSEPVAIYDVLEGEPEPIRYLKIRDLLTFERARQAMTRGSMEEAQQGFQAYLEGVPGDQAALHFLSLVMQGPGGTLLSP